MDALELRVLRLEEAVARLKTDVGSLKHRGTPMHYVQPEGEIQVESVKAEVVNNEGE